MSLNQTLKTSKNPGQVLLWYLLFAALFSIWTDRTLEFWLSLVAHKTVEIPWYLSLAATVLLGPVTTAFNIISEIARLVF